MQTAQQMPPDVYGLPEGLFSLDFALPSGPARQKGPEYALRFAILEDAIMGYLFYRRREGKRPARIAAENAEWLFSDSEEWPFSFVNICAVLGLDPAYVRRGIHRAEQLGIVRGNIRLRAIPGRKRVINPESEERYANI